MSLHVLCRFLPQYKTPLLPKESPFHGQQLQQVFIKPQFQTNIILRHASRKKAYLWEAMRNRSAQTSTWRPGATSYHQPQQEKEQITVPPPPPEEVTQYTLREITGDLFNSPGTDALAHCVSRDFAMGRGVAAVFLKNYGGVEELKAQNKTVGQAATLKRGHRCIYYLITKGRYWEKPTYESLRLALMDMKQHMLQNNVKNLSMPQIGCGLDRLVWDEVKKMIDETFQDLPVLVSIYSLSTKNK